MLGGFLLYPAYLFVDSVLLGNMDDETYLISFGLAMCIIGLTLEAICIGICACTETLVSQAFGANDFKLCRIYLNRQYLINTIIFAILFVAPVFFLRDFFETALSQRAIVSDLAF